MPDVDHHESQAGHPGPVTDALDLRAGEGRSTRRASRAPKISVDDSGDHASGDPSGMRSSPAPAGPAETKTS